MTHSTRIFIYIPSNLILFATRSHPRYPVLPGLYILFRTLFIAMAGKPLLGKYGIASRWFFMIGRGRPGKHGGIMNCSKLLHGHLREFIVLYFAILLAHLYGFLIRNICVFVPTFVCWDFMPHDSTTPRYLHYNTYVPIIVYPV